MKAKKHLVAQPARTRKAIEKAVNQSASVAALPTMTHVARRCEDCRVTNAFHAWHDLHLTPSYNWEIDFTADVAIPSGKRAVVELVTAQICVPAGERTRLRMYTSLGTSPSNLDLVVISQGSVDGIERFVATHSIRAYSDQLISFDINRDNCLTEADALICISGYLVDV